MEGGRGEATPLPARAEPARGPGDQGGHGGEATPHPLRAARLARSANPTRCRIHLGTNPLFHGLTGWCWKTLLSMYLKAALGCRMMPTEGRRKVAFFL
jgi:hypothetical protein